MDFIVTLSVERGNADKINSSEDKVKSISEIILWNF